MSRLRRYLPLELANGEGAILVDPEGLPLPIPPGHFLGDEDADDFAGWLCREHAEVTSADRLRQLARLWQRVRSWLPCATCKERRAAPGHKDCEVCEGDRADAQQRAAREGAPV